MGFLDIFFRLTNMELLINKGVSGWNSGIQLYF